MATEKVKVDPVTVAVIERRLYGIVTQMSETLVRTSMSPIFAEARDIAGGIFDKGLRLIALQEYLPAVAGAIIPGTRHIAEYWKDDIHDGDIFAHNEVESGNSHQPDINIAKPVFYDGELVFWSVTKGHHADIGGRGLCGYDPTAQTCWDDGIIIKPVKLYDSGKYNKSVWDLIVAQTKLPQLITNDLRCQCGACTVGERLLKGLIDEYNLETVYGAMDEIIAATEGETRYWIDQIPDGVYYGEKAFDNDAWDRAKPVTVRAKVTIKGDHMSVDLSDSDPQTPGYLNSGYGNDFCDVFMTMRFFLPGEIRADQGLLNCMDFITGEHNCVNPDFPAAHTMDTCTFTETIFEAIMLALSRARPDWATAAHGKMSLHISMGFDQRIKRPFAIIDFATCANGSGATEDYDGWPQGGPTHCCGRLRSPDPEVMELCTPQIMWQNELTGYRHGTGKWRGGFGGIYKVEYRHGCEAAEVGQGHFDYATPTGLFGGGSPPPSSPRVRHKDGTVEDIDVNVFWTVKDGDVYEQEMQGGGGYGDPLERDPEMVQKDVDDEFVTVEEAKEVHGVILKPMAEQPWRWEVNYEATEEERKRLKVKS